VLQLLVASGPYSVADSESLQPLEDMLARIKETRPHLTVLFGPFVDVKSSWTENHTESYDQLFGNMLRVINSAIEELETEVILVPSQRDAHAHCVYPQPPFVLGSDYTDKIRYRYSILFLSYLLLYVFGTGIYCTRINLTV
jgi:DNA polymerase alpha subunit B